MEEVYWMYLYWQGGHAEHTAASCGPAALSLLALGSNTGPVVVVGPPAAGLPNALATARNAVVAALPGLRPVNAADIPGPGAVAPLACRLDGAGAPTAGPVAALVASVCRIANYGCASAHWCFGAGARGLTHGALALGYSGVAVSYGEPGHWVRLHRFADWFFRAPAPAQVAQIAPLHRVNYPQPGNPQHPGALAGILVHCLKIAGCGPSGPHWVAYDPFSHIYSDTGTRTAATQLADFTPDGGQYEETGGVLLLYR
jgi:hypothetical protein